MLAILLCGTLFTLQVISKLVFVDLAGSERVKRNKSTGLQLEEAK